MLALAYNHTMNLRNVYICKILLVIVFSNSEYVVFPAHLPGVLERCHVVVFPNSPTLHSCLVHDVILFGSELTIVCLSCNKMTHTKVRTLHCVLGLCLLYGCTYVHC